MLSDFDRAESDIRQPVDAYRNPSEPYGRVAECVPTGRAARRGPTSSRSTWSRLAPWTPRGLRVPVAVGMERLGSLRMALPVFGPGSGEAARLEELEVLSLGIEGKRMLWKVLGTRASSDGRLVGFDFAGLERRAESQRRRLEPFRLGLAAAALAG